MAFCAVRNIAPRPQRGLQSIEGRTRKVHHDTSDQIYISYILKFIRQRHKKYQQKSEPWCLISICEKNKIHRDFATAINNSNAPSLWWSVQAQGVATAHACTDRKRLLCHWVFFWPTTDFDERSLPYVSSHAGNRLTIFVFCWRKWSCFISSYMEGSIWRFLQDYFKSHLMCFPNGICV